MSNNNTPMKQLKHYIDSIVDIARFDFSILRLNRSNKKYNPHRFYYSGGYSLGVDVDHILILKNKKNAKSIAISFNYMNRDTSDWTVRFSYKKFDVKQTNRYNKSYEDDVERAKLNKSIEYSYEYSIANAKVILKELMAELTVTGDVSKTIFSFIRKYVNDSELKLDIEKQLSENHLSIRSLHEDELGNIETLAKYSESVKSTLDKNEKLLHESLIKDESYQLVLSLKQQMKQAKADLKIKEDQLAIAYNTDALEKELKSVNGKLLDAKHKITYSLTDKIKQAPIHLRSELFDLFDIKKTRGY